MRRHSIVYTMTGACGLTGGIASMNRNMLHALVELASDLSGELTVLSYLEKKEDRPHFLPEWAQFTALGGNKTSLAVKLLNESSRRPLFCFDHVSLALPLLPFAAAGLVRTVIFAHGSESWKRLTRISRWSYQNASLCLTNSEFTLEKMRHRISEFNGRACPLGLAPEFELNMDLPRRSNRCLYLEAADGRGRDLGKRYLLLVGRLHPEEREKGHRQLIEVLPELAESFPDAQLVFPGPGEDQEYLKSLALRRGVGAAVFVPGLVSAEVLVDLYRNCFSYVMPSKQEGFGLAYLEAMNWARPCVGCFDDGAEDVIVHGETGFLIRDPNRKRDLLDVLHKILAEPALAERLGRGGFERLHARFTARHFKDRVKSNILEVL